MKRNKRGFTLLEVAVSLVIIGIIVLGFSGLMVSYLQIKNIMGDKSRAINRGRTVMEYLKTRNLSRLLGVYNGSEIKGLEVITGIEDIRIIIEKYRKFGLSDLYRVCVEIKPGEFTYKLVTVIYQRKK